MGKPKGHTVKDFDELTETDVSPTTRAKGHGKNVLSQRPSPIQSVLPALQSSRPQNSATIFAACRFQIEQNKLEYARNLEQIIFSAALIDGLVFCSFFSEHCTTLKRPKTRSSFESFGAGFPFHTTPSWKSGFFITRSQLLHHPADDPRPVCRELEMIFRYPFLNQYRPLPLKQKVVSCFLTQDIQKQPLR